MTIFIPKLQIFKAKRNGNSLDCMSLIDYDCEFIIILIRVVFIFTAVLNFTVAVIGNKSHNLVYGKSQQYITSGLKNIIVNFLGFCCDLKMLPLAVGNCIFYYHL